MSFELTQLLTRWRAGDRDAERAVIEEIYPLLRALAHKQLAAGHSCTVQPTELAHEAYLRLRDQRRVDWQDREHFFAIVGRIVRRVVIDHVRERRALKRGVQVQKVSLDMLGDSEPRASIDGEDWLRMDQVLTELEGFDPEGARLVEMRYFVGLSVVEVARSWQVSEATVARQWRATRAWLGLRLAGARDAPHA